MELVPDENLTYLQGPSYILVILATALLSYLLLLLFWTINSLKHRNSLKRNLLHQTLTTLFILNLIIHAFGLGVIVWIETQDTDDVYIWGMTALDAYALMKLFLITSLFIVKVLISRGWCITKESDSLNQLDRQLLFLQTLGIAFANVLATNYINKIAVVIYLTNARFL